GYAADTRRDVGPGHRTACASFAALRGAALHRCPRRPSRRSGAGNARGRDRHHDQDGAVRNMTSTRLQAFQIADWLPPGVGVDDVIVLLASLATLAMFFAMWQTLRPNSPIERRFEQIVHRKE